MTAGRLEALQRRFVRTVTFMADAEFAAGVTGGGRLTAEQAVDVYRKGYPARLTEALGETYEACWRVLGDEEFLAAAAAYVARTPSRSHNLSDYGEGFAEFLESRPSAVHAPFAGDLARFEWTYKDLFHEKPHAGLAPDVLAARARPDAVLRLGQAARLLSLRRRVYGIWRRDRADDTPLEPRDWDGAERLVLYKKGGNPVFVKELTAAEHAALAGLAAGLPLQDALAAAEGLDAEGARALFAFLAESGLVTEAA